jgi:7-cyano-7-deazaguanine reductase
MPRKKYGERAIEKAELEVWDNPSPDKDYLIEITFPEFTCLCPRSGYPDFAVVKVSYVPDRKIVELRSLKLWLNKFRSVYISHESVSNKIFDSLWNVLEPRQLKVVMDFHPRGNVHTIVTIEKDKEKKSKVRK